MNDLAEQTAECLRLIADATQTIIDMLYQEATAEDAVEATQRAAEAAHALHIRVNQ